MYSLSFTPARRGRALGTPIRWNGYLGCCVFRTFRRLPRFSPIRARRPDAGQWLQTHTALASGFMFRFGIDVAR